MEETNNQISNTPDIDEKTQKLSVKFADPFEEDLPQSKSAKIEESHIEEPAP